MGNHAAVEATSETVQPQEAKRPAFIYRVLFVGPLLVAAFGLAGYLKMTIGGLPIEYTASWLALVAAGVCWAYTHWFAFLRRKPIDA